MLSVTKFILQIGLVPGEQILLKLIIAVLAFGLVVFVSLWAGRRRTRIPDQQAVTASKFNVATIPTFRNSAEHISKEFARMRRYDRPLSIVIIRLKSDLLAENDQNRSARANGKGTDKSMEQPNQLSFLMACSLLLDALRESDIATYDPTNNQFILILPESNKSQALLTIMRLQSMFSKRTATDLEAGISEFPNEGLIIDDLVSKAALDCKPFRAMTVQQSGQLSKIKSASK